MNKTYYNKTQLNIRTRRKINFRLMFNLERHIILMFSMSTLIKFACGYLQISYIRFCLYVWFGTRNSQHNYIDYRKERFSSHEVM